MHAVILPARFAEAGLPPIQINFRSPTQLLWRPTRPLAYLCRIVQLPLGLPRLLVRALWTMVKISPPDKRPRGSLKLWSMTWWTVWLHALFVHRGATCQRHVECERSARLALAQVTLAATPMISRAPMDWFGSQFRCTKKRFYRNLLLLMGTEPELLG